MVAQVKGICVGAHLMRGHSEEAQGLHAKEQDVYIHGGAQKGCRPRQVEASVGPYGAVDDYGLCVFTPGSVRIFSSVVSCAAFAHVVMMKSNLDVRLM